MMRRISKRAGRLTTLLLTAFFMVLGVLFLLFFFDSSMRFDLEEEWKRLTRESRRILGWEKNEIPLEEKRIREEVILKKMREASAHQDWRSFAPEYPRSKKMESLTEGERNKALKNSQEFKDMEKEVRDYLRKKEDVFPLEPSIPPLKEEASPIPSKDRGVEKVIERLLSKKEKPSQERPLEENVLLRIRGPLATRKIVEKPHPPQVKVKIEVEIELTFWVLPDGTVDRVVPSIKGDAELERIAIQYMKQWRFAPLPMDQPQVEEWGIIPMRFKLR
jgi:TonB family protein